MTPNQYLEWLDHMIESAERVAALEVSPARDYWVGQYKGLKQAKDRFDQVEFDPKLVENQTIEYPQPEPENKFIDGLE
jgi:hypothetical protein